MKIIKPYGRTLTVQNKNSLVRKIDLKDKAQKSIEDFMIYKETRENKLLISQWISIIDKIIKRPSKNKSKNKNDAEYETAKKARNLIGKESWELIKNEFIGTNEDLKSIWDFKIEAISPRNSNKNQKNYKGKLYDKFVGDKIKISSIDNNKALEIARKIQEHLLEKEINNPNIKYGLIGHRAHSISNNVISVENIINRIKENTITDEAKEQYKNTNLDLAKKIISLDCKNRYDAAMKEMSEYWKRIFKDENGKIMNFKEAREQKAELLKLHLKIKEFYKATLKNTKKNKLYLPDNMEDLYKKIEQKIQNRNVNDLIRLGKIIHYDYIEKNNKNNSNCLDNDTFEETRLNLKSSKYLTSAGQHEIKRKEAFVRIWIKSLAMAARTIKDWVDPESKLPKNNEGIYQDILSTKEYVKEERIIAQANLLFNDKDISEHADEFIHIARQGIRNLRNEAFHFKIDAKNNFIKSSLKKILSDEERQNLINILENFWNKDEKALINRYIEIMESAHLGRYFSEEQNKKIFKSINDNKNSEISLPRFNRIINRANNTKLGKSLNLPKKVNQDIFKERKYEQCKYIAMKLLYESSFKSWLINSQNYETLNDYIKKSFKRMTQQARNINKKNSTPEFMINAKAEIIGLLNKGETIKDFFSRLSAYMSSEMRIQDGYQTNKDEAKKQSSYIENLKSDVLIMAFEDFINKEGFKFITKIDKNSEYSKADNAHALKDIIKSPISDKETEEWEYILYFLIHLIPVENISELLQQIYKWDNLSDGQEYDNKIIHILRKYIIMHDARYSGGISIEINDIKKDFGHLFEKEYLINEIIGNGKDDMAVSTRALREIKRFGYYSSLNSILEDFKIKEETVMKYKKSSEKIEEYQKRRAKIHEKWIKERSISPDKAKEYKECIKYISEYRGLSRHVKMQDFIDLGRLMISVLGRLVDYSVILERDLYFVTLALIYKNKIELNKKIRKPLANRGNENLSKAIKELSGKSPQFKEEIIKYMKIDKGDLDKTKSLQIRNDFAHFNILDNNDADINLTKAINDARIMMSYDRKLKNAVSKSIIDLLERNGIKAEWKCDNHKLSNVKMFSKKIIHLGGMKVKLSDGNKIKIEEYILPKNYINMVSVLFGDKRKIPVS